MGLDNGFLVKSNIRKITRDMLPADINYPFEEDYNGEPEVIYWRKCWGLRNDIMETFGWTDNYFEPNDPYVINTPKQVAKLIEIIASWMNESRWEEDGRSIWDYEEIHNTLINNIMNLTSIYAFMSLNPDVYLEFYDSY